MDRIPPDLAASLVLVRHGESTWIAEGRFQGASDPPLSERGRLQAARVAERLADPLAPPPLPLPPGDPAGCWHSPLRRAAAVAEAIRDSRPRPLPLHPDARFAEIAHGDWEGRLHAEIVARDADRYRGWRRDPIRHGGPGGEPLADATRRVASGLHDVLAALASARRATEGPHRPRPWGILVAHEGSLRLALLTLFELPLERFWLFPFGLCAISVVEFHEGRPLLRAHNLAGHLAGLEGSSRAPASGDRVAL